MAKKKSSKPIAEEVKEEVVEVVTDEEVIEEAPVEVADSAVEEEVVEVAEAPVDDEKSNQFLYAQLKAINKLNNPAKARRLAERIKRNRKR